MKTVIVAALFLLSLVASAGTPIDPVGTYSTVSESEWEIELQLNKNHSATLITSQWDPGDRVHATKKRRVGTWRRVGNEIETTFQKSSVVFTFDPQLSFEQFQRQGAASGLVGVSGSLDYYKFGGMHFWLKSDLAKVKW